MTIEEKFLTMKTYEEYDARRDEFEKFDTSNLDVLQKGESV